MIPSTKSFLLSVLLLILFAFSSHAQIYYVTQNSFNASDFNACLDPEFPCSTINGALSKLTNSGFEEIFVDFAIDPFNPPSPGFYNEDLVINSRVQIFGASGTTLSTTNGITINSSDVTISGFFIDGSITSSGYSNIIIEYCNINFPSDSEGIIVRDVSSGQINLRFNFINMRELEDSDNPGTGTKGILLENLSGTVDVNLISNSIRNASWGIYGFGLSSSVTPVIEGGTIRNCVRGMEFTNFNGSIYLPSSASINGVRMLDFFDPDPDVSSPDSQAGIYAFVNGGATSLDDIGLAVINVEISEVGNSTVEDSGIYLESTAAIGGGIDLSASIVESEINNNKNRGVFVEGATVSVAIDQSEMLGNGYDPNTSTGANGYSIIADQQSSVSITNSIITNASIQASDQTSGLFANNSASITASGNSIQTSGNGFIAEGVSLGILNLSGNWLGDTDASIIQSGILSSNLVDITPYLGSGADLDGGEVGFLGGRDLLYITDEGIQSESETRLSEGYNLVNPSGTLVLPFGDYNETLTIDKNLTLRTNSFGVNDSSLDNLIINGSGIDINLDGNLLINNALTLTNGDLHVESGELIIGPSVANVAESVQSKIVGFARMQSRLIGLGAIEILGVSIEAGTDNIGNVNISRSTGSDAVITDGPNSSIAANWSITVDNQPVSGRDVTFSWFSDFDNSIDQSNISVFRNEGSGWGKVDGPIDVSSSNPRVINLSGITQFSEWTMADDAKPLPVELIKFDAKFLNGELLVQWATASEINADYFEIQKSLDGENFTIQKKIDAKGQSNEIVNYEWKDTNAHKLESVYYKLKMVDYDGSYEFSDIIFLPHENSLQSVVIFPQPAKNVINLSISDFEYSIYDLFGREIRNDKSESSQIAIDFLESGVYFLKVEGFVPIRFFVE